MKRHNILFGFTILFLSFSISCSSDDKVDPDPKAEIIEQLIGEWTLVSYEGGIAGLPETTIQDNVKVSFTKDGSFKRFEDDQLVFEGMYQIDFFNVNGQENVLLKVGETMQWRLFFNNARMSLDENAINGADGFTYHYIKQTSIEF